MFQPQPTKLRLLLRHRLACVATRGCICRGLLADRGLLKGKRIGIDATPLEANAALRSIVRRDNGESYEEFLTGLAQESGIKTPTREDPGRVDRKRTKKTSTGSDGRRTSARSGLLSFAP